MKREAARNNQQLTNTIFLRAYARYSAPKIMGRRLALGKVENRYGHK